jgi:hypothetical protein
VSSRESLTTQGFVKVKLTSDDGIVETLWAVRVGENRFELRNSPWFSYGISDGDVVEGVQYAPDMYEFTRVVEPSGNRTIRVILAADANADTDAGKAVLAGLNGLGCNYENMNNTMISVVVPPGVELGPVADFLVGTGLLWEYANPTR